MTGETKVHETNLERHVFVAVVTVVDGGGGFEQDVFELDISMQHLAGVKVGHGLEKLSHDATCFVLGQSSVAASRSIDISLYSFTMSGIDDPIEQFAPPIHLADDMNRVIIFVAGDHLDDVGMIHRGEHADFALQIVEIMFDVRLEDGFDGPVIARSAMGASSDGAVAAGAQHVRGR